MLVPSIVGGCDAPIVHTDSSASSKRRGRPPVSAMAVAGGPPVLALLIGRQSGGRWQDELSGTSKASRSLAEAVRRSASSVSDQDQTVGLAVFCRMASSDWLRKPHRYLLPDAS